MKCIPIGIGFVCGSRARTSTCSVPSCGRETTKLCDFVIGRTAAGKQRTCSAKLCDAHAEHRGEGDLCPPHAKMRITVQG